MYIYLNKCMYVFMYVLFVMLCMDVFIYMHFFYLHIYTIKTKKYNHQVRKYRCAWDPSKKRVEQRTKNDN